MVVRLLHRLPDAASVNNFRRWDQAFPKPVVATLRPFVQGLEIIAQRTGRGWWGPSQFLVATRQHGTRLRLMPTPGRVPPSVAELARRMVCPPAAASSAGRRIGHNAPAAGGPIAGSGRTGTSFHKPDGRPAVTAPRRRPR
jgi:hypothetical protein